MFLINFGYSTLHKKVCCMIATIREKYASVNNGLAGTTLFFASHSRDWLLEAAKTLMRQVLQEIFSRMVREPRGV